MSDFRRIYWRVRLHRDGFWYPEESYDGCSWHWPILGHRRNYIGYKTAKGAARYVNQTIKWMGGQNEWAAGETPALPLALQKKLALLRSRIEQPVIGGAS